MFAAYHQTCQPTISSSTVSTSRRADALPRLEASTWSAKEYLDTTGGRRSRVHNRLAVVIGAGSLVVEVATALAGQAQQWVSSEGSNINKYEIGSTIKRSLPPSWKSIRRHYYISAVHDPILVKCGMLTQNDMTITAMRSKSKLKKMTDLKRKIAHWSCRY